MNFTSPAFLFYFLPFLLIIYLVSPEKIKNTILILASAIFYFWGEGNYLFYLYVWVVINYITSLLIDKSQKHSGFYLTLAIFINLGILLYFKYTNFLLSNLNYLGLENLKELKIYLPLALSFFTFHAISYNIDTYRKVVKPESSLSRMILYFTFFPHLIAGPIIRYHQIKDALFKRDIKSWMISQGILRFVVGLAKKVIIADTLASIVDEIFGIGPMHISLYQAWLGVICFGLQIYYDFSAYTDMAIGLGLIFGFKFPENFNYPYISTSITDFWRRWHMTLSSWVRDYIYIPLGGNRKGVLRTYLNLIIAFSLVGLWHGANWTFLAWGFFHALLMVLERVKEGILINWMPNILKHTYTILSLLVSWVFFRSTNLPEAFEYIKLMFTGSNNNFIYHSNNFFLGKEALIAIFLGVIFATPLPKRIINYFENLITKRLIKSKTGSLIILNFIKLIVFISLFTLSLVYVAGPTYKSFIYFRF